MFRNYIQGILRLAWRSSWEAANGVEGAMLAGGIMIWRGILSIVVGEGQVVKTANWTISFALYTAISLVVLFIFRFVFIAPFQFWKVEREARIAAERKANNREERRNIRMALSDLHSQGIALMENCRDSTNPPPLEEAKSWAIKLMSSYQRA